MSQPSLQHIDPDGLHAHPAFTDVVVIDGAARTVYVAGRNATTADGEVVGSRSLAAQTHRAFDDLERALGAVRSDLSRVVKWNIHVVDGQPLEDGFAVLQERWPAGQAPPAITVAVITSLAHPEFLVESDAIAVA